MLRFASATTISSTLRKRIGMKKSPKRSGRAHLEGFTKSATYESTIAAAATINNMRKSRPKNQCVRLFFFVIYLIQFVSPLPNHKNYKTKEHSAKVRKVCHTIA